MYVPEPIDCFECSECGKLHKIDDDTFFTFYGNVTVGLHGGIIGNNLDEEGRVVKTTIFCRSISCLKSFVQAIKDLPPTIRTS